MNAIRAFQDMARYLKATVAGIVYGSSGEAGAIQQQPKTLAKAYELGKRWPNKGTDLFSQSGRAAFVACDMAAMTRK